MMPVFIIHNNQITNLAVMAVKFFFKLFKRKGYRVVNQKTNIFLIDPPLFSLQEGNVWNLFFDLLFISQQFK